MQNSQEALYIDMHLKTGHKFQLDYTKSDFPLCFIGIIFGKFLISLVKNLCIIISYSYEIRRFAIRLQMQNLNGGNNPLKLRVSLLNPLILFKRFDLADP